jgi:hypothetical protein
MNPNTEPNPLLKERQHRRWLALWRQWGKPRLSLELGYQPVPFGDFEGYLGSTGIVIREAGEAFAVADVVMLPFKVFACDKDITNLVGSLSGLPTEGGDIVLLHHFPSWQTMGVIVAAVLVAHLNAATEQRDVEALRALDIAVAKQHVADVEAELLAEATSCHGVAVASPTTFSTRSERRRL